jgi:hypothetical protein
MAGQAGPSITVAELVGIRRQARQMRLTSRQAHRSTVETYTQATMQSAARIRCSPPPGPLRDQPGGSSLAQLLQPLLGKAPAGAGNVVSERELTVVRPLRTPASGWELSQSLANIRRQVNDLYRDLQGTRASHLRLLDPAAAPASRRGVGRTAQRPGLVLPNRAGVSPDAQQPPN